MFESFTITVSNYRSNKDFVLIEQEPWDPFIDTLTKLGAVAYLNKLLYDEGSGVNPNCSTALGICNSTLYVYPSRPDLVYKLAVTYGTLQKPVIKILGYTETIQTSLELNFSPRYPTEEILRCVWVGDVYNQDGEMVSPPEVDVDGTDISVSEKVYGTLLITYEVYRHIYKVSIPKRVSAIENSRQSFAYAIWDGGNEVEEIEIPAMAEQDQCSSHGSGQDHFTGGDDVPGPVSPDDQTVWIDYCTQLVRDTPVIG